MKAQSASPVEPIAIVGIGCRFPGAKSVAAYWKLMMDGVDAITEVPPERWDVDACYDPRPGAPGKIITRFGGFLEDVDQFDPYFFGISPREANQIDPRQRLLLEVAWEAAEDAGLPVERMVGSRTGVFVGICKEDYSSIQQGNVNNQNVYVSTGAGRSSAGRVAQVFGLNGPAMTIDTACSSSLVAVHLACTSIRVGECELAFAGGANLILTPDLTVCFSRNGILSPDGRSKAFDASADGYVRSEGVGMVLLKPLAHALADRDPIYAVIRGSAVNHNGNTGSFMTPSPEGQQAVLEDAYRQAGVSPLRVRYVEAHGTGTRVGDPAEVEGLNRVLGAGRPMDQPCLIGSGKTNIGHSEGAAGIAGLIKAALILKHRTIPPSLHCSNPNPNIPWDNIPFIVQREAAAWPAGDYPALAGVNSFGISGTNAHAVLEEAPPAAPAPKSPQRAPGVAQILPISAKTEDALRALARSYRERLHEPGRDAAALCDICYTAAVRRSHHVRRLALVGHSTEQMRRRIDAFLEAEPCADRSRDAEAPKPVFVFSGVGSHWPSMGRKLRDVEPVFHNVLLRCDDIVRRLGGWSLIEAIDAPPDESLLDRIDIMQPAIFGMQAALAALWRSWGIEPAAVVGHSLGEYAAAHVAGAITLEEGLRAVSIRGRLMHRWSGLGRMLAVELTPDTAREAIAGYADSVSLAAWNSPASSVLSGDPAALGEVMDRLQREGVFCRWVKVEVACHSGQMETILGEYREALGALRPRPESILIYSTVTAGRLSGEDLDADYWARNVRDPVLFAPLIETLLANGNDTFLEVSPHPVLLAPIRQTALHSSRNVETLSSLKREHDERAALLESLAALYVAGCPVDWRNLHPAGGRVVSLPAYQWQRERFWFEPPRESRRSKHHPLLPVYWESAENPGAHVWETELDLTVFPYLDDHRFQGVPLLPVAAYIEMALAASIEAFGPGPRVFRNVELLRPLFLSERQPRRIQLLMSPARPGYAVFRFYSLEQTAWVVCVKGMVQYEGVEFEEVADTALSPETLSRDYSRQLDAATFYSRAGEAGLEYRWAFRAVERAGYSPASGRGMIVIQPFRAMGYSSHGYHIHPARLDAVFQSALLRVMSVEGNASIASLPVEIGELQVHALPPDDTALSCRVKLHPREEDLWRSDVEVFDEGGRLILRELGHRSKLVRDTKRDVPRSDTSSWLYQVRWESEPPAAAVHTGSESWLILADSGGLGERLRDALEAAGDSCGLVPAGRLEAVAGILAANPPRNMLYLWPLDAPRNEALSLESLAGSQRRLCGSVLSLVHTLANRDGVSAPRLWIVTRGAQPVTPQAGPASLAQAPLLGLARVIANEHRELLVTAVDLDPACPPGEAAALVAELRIAQPGQEVAYRDDVRYVARLFRYNPQSDLPPIRPIIASVSSDRSYELTTRGGGVLKNLTLREVARRPPGPGEIEIQVSAAGLNFLDVLKALDMAPGLPPGPVWFGMECAGRVAAVGEGVAGFQVGDEVIARDVSVGCLRAFLTAPAGSVFRKPPHLTLAEAATIPVAYQTAYYALLHLARLRKGESVLIHSAAGGVGLAALEIARQAGAEVFATAGTPEKRDYLRSLGVSHVMNSRTLDFAREIMTDTGGRGVDVVLNSLAGEAIPKSLSVLAAGGRFLEIGKRDIYANSQLGLLPFQKNLAFFAIDLLRLSMECPETYAALSREVQSRIADGAFKPLPYTSFPIARVAEAFSFMAQGKHTGKIVVEMDGHEVQAEAAPVKACAIRSDAAYLITGGLGGLGLSVAQWLVAQGARHLVLVGRRGPTPEVQPALDSLREAGARIEVFSADVSRPEDLVSVLGHVRGAMPPLKGVVHCAGVLSDGVLQRLDWPRFETVFAPKLQGAWNLHVQLLGTPLDFFVLFSSVASVFGSPAQGNYAAANAFLDSLAHYRAARGLPALAINWGPWAEVGMAAQPNRGGRLAELGTESIPPNDGVRVLGDLLGERSPQVAVVPINWKRSLESRPELRRALLFARLAAEFANDSTGPRDGGEETVLLDSIIDAPNAGEGRRVLESYLGKEIAKILKVPASRLDPHAGLNRLGLDSLMAVELANSIQLDLPLSIPVVKLLQGPSVVELAAWLYEEIEKAAESVNRLSDEEVDSILAK